MGNLNITLEGYTNRVAEKMMLDGFVKTKTEAIRLALYEFDQRHRLLGEEEAYSKTAKKILDDIDSGRQKRKKFKISGLVR